MKCLMRGHLFSCSLVHLFKFFYNNNDNNNYYYYYLLLEFSTPAMADGFSLGFEWWKVSSSLQDSSQNSGQSPQYCSLDGLHSSSCFHVHLPCINLWLTVPSAPITIGITVTFMSHNIFRSLAKSRYIPFFSLSFFFTLWSSGTAKSTLR